MTTRRRARRETDERGLSVSVFAGLVLGAMILTVGLVVDGGQKITAATRAETTAASAARVAGNAGATQSLGGRSPAGSAVVAARAYLAGQPGVTGSVSVSGGVVTVRTRTSEPTVFLSVVGITRVNAEGYARSDVIPSGGGG